LRGKCTQRNFWIGESVVGSRSGLTSPPGPGKLRRFFNQEGNTLTYGSFFSRKPSIVVFFYTRCDNPNKCSLTVTKLARLQRAIADEELEGLLRTAAITYDPAYDLPPRLRAYGENRGIAFSDDNRMFRARTGFRELQEHFQLGVNFTGSTVNRHIIELFVLDSRGEMAVAFTRLQWDLREVLEQARALLGLE
jgi:protein SCO1/2